MTTTFQLHSNIFKEIQKKTNLKINNSYLPYNTQNFRTKSYKKQTLILAKSINNIKNHNNKNQQPNEKSELIVDKPNNSNQQYYIPLANIKLNKQINKLNKLSCQKRNQTFYKTFYSSRLQSKSLQQQKKQIIQRPPTSQILEISPFQSCKKNVRIRKISHINQESNTNFLAKYQIIRQLGKGTYGTVHLAKIKKAPIISKIINKYKYFSNNKMQKLSQILIQNQQSQQQIISENKINQSKILNNQAAQIKYLQNSKQILKNNIQNLSTICQLNININESHQTIGQSKTTIQKNIIESKTLQLEQQNIQDQLVAIKVYQKFKMNKDPSKFKNIRKQITIMQNLNHEGIIKLYESVQSLTKISLVVQYGGNQSLLDYLKNNFPLSQNKVKYFSKQLLETIIYLHNKNIVHRDIKPQNILVKQTHETNKQQLKLIDFGFSTLTNKTRKLNAICGTPNFMAPELLSSKQYFGEKVDVWSFGVVVFVLAEGRHPFKSNNLQELQRLVNKGKYTFKRNHSNEFKQFIEKILRINSNERPTANNILNFKWLQSQQ